MLSQKVQAFMLCRYLKIVNTVVSSSPILHQYCSKCFVSTEEQFSVWPFYCVINELSFIERTKRQNMIFAGLWYGDSKPSMDTFLTPLSDTLRKLEDDGITVQPAGLASEPFVCKVFTIAGT